MWGYVLKRTLSIIPVSGVVAVLAFLLLRLSPGDPAIIMAGDSATAEQIAAMRSHMGLDQPLVAQFLLWLSHILRGDLGVSLHSAVPVTEMIGGRVGPTLALAVTTMTFSVLVAIPMGLLAAWARGTSLDRAIMALAVLGFSAPVFVTGYTLVWLLSIKAGWFPIQGYAGLSEGFWAFARHIALPALSLSTIYVALIARICRSSILEILNEDFIRTARAKGAGETTVFLRHALRNAAVPIVTVIGLGAAFLISGVVVAESVFNIPGVGRLVVESVLARDYPLIQALILLFSCVYILLNLVIDLSYTLLDPRIRY
ncbi:ABC transporter permease [Frigidibacter sp. MR17.24]|uniref:ABC transporter permease n=1 Tax=Frigidibacter sp. MR17.24 TaxID=3127345 RepID=UPI0030130EF0